MAHLRMAHERAREAREARARLEAREARERATRHFKEWSDLPGFHGRPILARFLKAAGVA